MDKNISIITNFGCDSNCWYCVWKNHKLKNYNKIDYNKLENFLIKYKYKGKVSLSGGGDPLYNYFENLNFWIWIINFTHKHNIKLDIHTRVKFTKQKFWRKHVNLCAFSSDKLDDDKDYLLYLSKLTKTRIIHVVTQNDTKEDIENYINFANKNNIQVTFKQLFGYSDEGNYNLFKKDYNAYFLDNKDYNIYFMPDNKVYDSFII